jgi:hypothetical protein
MSHKADLFRTRRIWRHLVPVLLATVLSLSVSANQGRSSEQDLRDRILAANTFQYYRPLNGCLILRP